MVGRVRRKASDGEQMRPERIRVAIVAPVYNRKDITLQCLKSLSRIDSTGLDIHTIIVDDGSTDGTSEAIRSKYPHVQLVSGTGDLWYTEGTNVGIRAALKHKPKYVLAMNDDQVFDSQFLRYMIETAERYPRSIIGSILLLWDTPHKLFQTSPVWDTVKGGWRHWSHQTIWTIPEKPWEVDIIVGNCVLIPTTAIRECGLMDSRRFPNFGDAEYTPRLKRAGWRLLIDPCARVFCQPNNIPPRVRYKKMSQIFHDLFIDLKNVHSLRRRFYANLQGAPTKFQGVAAFFLYLAAAAIGKSPDSTKWAQTHAEPTLKDIVSPISVDD